MASTSKSTPPNASPAEAFSSDDISSKTGLSPETGTPFEADTLFEANLSFEDSLSFEAGTPFEASLSSEDTEALAGATLAASPSKTLSAIILSEIIFPGTTVT